MTTYVYLFLMLSATFAWSRPTQPIFSQDAAVYGTDNRTYMVSLNYPWRSIGHLTIDYGSGTCTATLIGQCHIVTAAHCVSTRNGAPLGGLQFRGSADTLVADVNDIEYGDYGVSSYEDWAVGRLSLSLGNKLSWFDLEDKAGTDLAGKSPFNIAGYSRDLMYGLLATLDDSVAVLYSGSKEGSNFIYHNGNTSKGSSGASIWYMDTATQRARVVGVNTQAIFGAGGTELRFKETPLNPRLLARGVATHQFYQRAQTFIKSHPCAETAN